MSRDVTKLIVDLSDTAAAVRIRAAQELAQLGEDSRGAVVGLVRATADQEEEVREWAVAALEEIGQPHTSDVGPLAELLTGSDNDVGYWSATLLGRLGSQAAPAVAALTAVVSGACENVVRQRAVWALGKIGPKAAGSLESLRQAAGGDDPRLSRLAQRAITQITQ